MLVNEIEAVKNDGVFPRFYMKPVRNVVKSNKKGRPVYEEVPYVEITTSGDRLNVIDRKVSEVDIARWPNLYERFQKGETEPIEGTPLKEAPFIPRSQVEELAYFKIHSVEQLASLSDTMLQDIGMGARDLMEKAKAYLKKAENTAKDTATGTEVRQLKEMVTALQQQNKDLIETVNKLEAQKGIHTPIKKDEKEPGSKTTKGDTK